jgi:hypothetical protein
MVRLRDRSDSFWDVAGRGLGYGAWPELAGWVEQRAAQILQEPEAGCGHGQPAPVGRGPVEDGPDQGEAAGLAGESADDVDLLRVSPESRPMTLTSCGSRRRFARRQVTTDPLPQRTIRTRHNVLTAMSTRVDQQRRFMKNYFQDDSILMKEYGERVASAFTSNPEAGFLKGLRNYITHTQLPVARASRHLDMGLSQSRSSCPVSPCSHGTAGTAR